MRHIPRIVGVMLGSSIHNGAKIDGKEQILQSIVDALRTPLGSRVMRPSYGSRLFFLLDRGAHADTAAEAIAAIIEGIINSVPGIEPKQALPLEIGKGFIKFYLSGVSVETGEALTFNGVEVAA